MACSWTFLWLLWIALVAVLLFALRGPLKISESLESGMFEFVAGPVDPQFSFSDVILQQPNSEVLRRSDRNFQSRVWNHPHL